MSFNKDRIDSFTEYEGILSVLFNDIFLETETDHLRRIYVSSCVEYLLYQDKDSITIYKSMNGVGSRYWYIHSCRSISYMRYEYNDFLNTYKEDMFLENVIDNYEIL